MSILVTVRIAGTIEKAPEVDESHPHLREQIGALAKKHGILAHRSFHREGQILDLDEWENEDKLNAFLADARPIIDELARRRGTGTPHDEIWQPA
jgi:hypothetical protein